MPEKSEKWQLTTKTGLLTQFMCQVSIGFAGKCSGAIVGGAPGDGIV